MRRNGFWYSMTTSDERNSSGASCLMAFLLFFLITLFISAGKVLVDKAFSLFAIESNKGPAAARAVDCL